MGNICSALKRESGAGMPCVYFIIFKAYRHILYTLYYSNCWKFPGGPAVRTPHFHCMDSMPGQGTNIP